MYLYSYAVISYALKLKKHQEMTYETEWRGMQLCIVYMKEIEKQISMQMHNNWKTDQPCCEKGVRESYRAGPFQQRQRPVYTPDL